MDEKDSGTASIAVPSGGDIEAAAQRLSKQWSRPHAPQRTAAGGQHLQSPVDCRARGVTVEVKRRRPTGPR